MITSVLQMLVFVVSAVAFACYVLKVDKRESQKYDLQEKFSFPEPKEEDHEHRGAAMSRL
jgi:hypothetical protein